MAITDKKISTVYNGRDISSLSDRPNEDGMQAPDLKARFDQLGKEIIPKLNALIDELFSDLYSGTSQNGHTHDLDNLVDGITYKLFTALERAKLSAIAENAEVNQNAFSNVKVGSSTIASSAKTDTFELVAGLNITMTVDALTKKVFFSATGDLATEAVQSLIVDIGNYYDALNVEDALQEIGYALANLSGNAEDIAITDVGEYFTSENVEGALQEVGAKLSPSSSKTTPVDADTLLVSDSADSSIFKKLSWANIKATLKTYFDTLYQSILVSGTNIKTINGNSVLGGGDVELLPKNNPIATGTQTLPNIVTNGIKFPATQVPSADPNTLDDYEEGSFTATFWSGRDKTGTSFTSAACHYVKIGSIVHLMIFRANFGAGLSVQSVTLPFAIHTDWLASGTTDSGVAFSNPSGNVDYVNFASAISDMYVRFSFTYKVE